MEATKKRGEGLHKLSNEIAQIYKEIDSLAPGSPGEEELAERLLDLRMALNLPPG